MISFSIHYNQGLHVRSCTFLCPVLTAHTVGVVDGWVDVDVGDGDTDGSIVGPPAISPPAKLLIKW